MRNLYLCTLAALLLLASSSTSIAQNRKTNLELKLISPAANATIAYGATFNVSVTIKNNGPDSLKATDTLVILHSGSNNPVSFLVSSLTGGGGLLNGATSPTGNVAQLQNANTSGTDQNVNFCAVLLNVNTAGLQINGTPLQVTWDDLDTTNNRSCAAIKLQTQPPSGIFDIKNNHETLVMGPNPANNEVTFVLDLENAGPVNVSIKDIQGREVMKKDYEKIASGKKVQLSLDISKLKAGLYFVELNNDNRKSVGKMVVQH